MIRAKKRQLKRIGLELFHKRMATILDSRLPLSKGIRRFAGEIRDPKFRQTLDRLSSRLENGESLSDAMSGDDRFFPPDYVAMIRIGERGGDLGDALNMVVKHERLQREFRESVKKVLMYPLTVFGLVCAGYAFTIFYTYPVFLDCFQVTGTRMPLVADAFFSMGSVLVFLFIGALFILRGPRLKKKMHGLLLRTPLLGKVLVGRFIVSFSEGLAVLLENGVPIPESMGLLAGVTENRSIVPILEKAEASARQGDDLELLLMNMGLFPDLYRSAVCTGLKTGTLTDSLFRLAGIYKSQMEYHANLLVRIMEVSLLLFIGIWVTIFGISVFSMYDGLLNLLDSSVRW